MREIKQFHTIAEAISMQRQDMNMTQQQLATALNIDRSTISKWENGDREPSHAMIKKIAEVLECNILFLLGVAEMPDVDGED